MASTTVPPTRIKICGLSTEPTLTAALEAGVDWIGLVHFPRSPRHVALAQAAVLSARARGRAERVVLLVDPDDALVAAVLEAVDPDLIQLHGRESPVRVAAIRALTGRPVMKALGLAAREDLAILPAYTAVADRILLDAKAPPDAVLPGGNGRAFDWGILRRMRSSSRHDALGRPRRGQRRGGGHPHRNHRCRRLIGGRVGARGQGPGQDRGLRGGRARSAIGPQAYAARSASSWRS